MNSAAVHSSHFNIPFFNYDLKRKEEHFFFELA